MKVISLILFTILLSSCSFSNRYDYNTLSQLDRGISETNIVNFFNLDYDEFYPFEFEGEKYKIYYQEMTIISSQTSYFSTYDVYVFLIKDSKLFEYGLLEDFRRSNFLINREVAKIVSEEL